MLIFLSSLPVWFSTIRVNRQLVSSKPFDVFQPRRACSAAILTFSDGLPFGTKLLLQDTRLLPALHCFVLSTLLLPRPFSSRYMIHEALDSYLLPLLHLSDASTMICLTLFGFMILGLEQATLHHIFLCSALLSPLPFLRRPHCTHSFPSRLPRFSGVIHPSPVVSINWTISLSPDVGDACLVLASEEGEVSRWSALGNRLGILRYELYFFVPRRNPIVLPARRKNSLVYSVDVYFSLSTIRRYITRYLIMRRSCGRHTLVATTFTPRTS